MSKIQISKRTLRRSASHPVTAAILLTSDYVPFVHLGAFCEINHTIKDMGECLERADQLGSVSAREPEHKALEESIKRAKETAEIAFEAAVDAAYQLYRGMEECECTHCQMRRQKAAAKLS